MGILILGLIVFLGGHSIAAFTLRLRERAVLTLGEGPWKGLYGLVAIIGFVLIVWGYGQARLHPHLLYTTPYWMRHVTFLLMLPVFPMFLAAYLPGRIRTTLKHPMLVAVKTWAVAHLLVNGTLADVLLFGGFLAWAVLVRISLKRRAPRPVPSLPRSGWNDAIAVAGGLAFYLAFLFWLHPLLIGVPLIG